MTASLALVLSRRGVVALVGVAALGVLAWFVLGDSDEAKVLARLEEIANAVKTRSDENMAFRALRLRPIFEEAFETGATLRAPELQDTSGVKELTRLAAGVPNYYGELDVSIGETDVHVEKAANLARVTAGVTVTGRVGGELQRDKRVVRFLLAKRDGDWRVEVIDVAPKTHEQPEARP